VAVATFDDWEGPGRIGSICSSIVSYRGPGGRLYSECVVAYSWLLRSPLKPSECDINICWLMGEPMPVRATAQPSNSSCTSPQPLQSAATANQPASAHGPSCQHTIMPCIIHVYCCVCMYCVLRSMRLSFTRHWSHLGLALPICLARAFAHTGGERVGSLTYPRVLRPLRCVTHIHMNEI
jgi:hypothetical protein